MNYLIIGRAAFRTILQAKTSELEVDARGQQTGTFTSLHPSDFHLY